MEANITFKLTEIAHKIELCKKRLFDIYLSNGYEGDLEKLKAELDEVSQQNKIRIVFIGQYTAGKSTIISALTTNNGILIDSNIATSSASDYVWNDVILTDTPGLYTENPEHDATTIETIRKSDLLVYCITSDLFNQYTKADFLKWAFEIGYSGKIFLLVNKMSKEAGEYDELVKNYSMTINNSLMPHSINEFSYSFIDAKDYKDGINENDRELIELSHFEEFITQINAFIASKGLLGKLDKPIKILKASIDDICKKGTDDDRDRAYNALLARIERKIDQQRSQFAIDSRNIIKRGKKQIIEKGYTLSKDLGVCDIQFSESEINDFISEVCQGINMELSQLCETNINTLNAEVEDILYSKPASYFINSIDGTYKESKHLFEKQETKVARAQFDAIKNVAEGITGKAIGLSLKSGGQSAGFLIKSTEASGSAIHKVVLGIGQKLGYKFKPWQAVNVAKNVGNIAKCAGPFIQVAGVIFSVKESIDDNKRANELAKAQIEYRQSFVDIANDLERSYNTEIKGMYDAYEEITSQVQENREKVQKLITSNSSMTNELNAIKNELIDVQKEIFI